ncbi:CoA ester lyase [Tersicoccus sp. Bi-70]|uniref:HpcH/HpaI aldolase/citrate lyase family protein n=1 Tax=Tersicoccus sp. Bi-70 TaxID=1897634 RepID=UPI000976850B|nr:CoA ester lyase [Tersicoccus sp. Bi-70]OMH31574.1 citrate lyase [Tersicoccus sp. Bi-70]
MTTSSTFALGPALLFCPADRTDRFAKAADRADAVILDLEDAVAPVDKDTARANLAEHPLDPARTVVRVNAAGTEDFDADVAALAELPYRTVMLAKTESTAQVRALAGHDVIALIETAAGALAVADIAAEPNVVALMWGAEDLVASLGGTGSRTAGGRYRAVATHVRSTVLLAAGAHGKAAIDAVYTAIEDTAGLTDECEDAAATGFAAKACIHPAQVAAVRAAFAPSEQQVADARELLAEAEHRPGVFSWRGAMIDEPILRHARAVVARADTGR